MNLVELTYIYAKHSLKHSVNRTLLLENWRLKDQDYAYPSYLTEYLKIVDLVDKKIVLAQDLQTSLIRKSEQTNNIIYDNVLKSFLKYIKGRLKIDSDKEYKIRSEMEKLKNINDINFDYIKKLRIIEKEVWEEYG
jgi:hypothetical protein